MLQEKSTVVRSFTQMVASNNITRVSNLFLSVGVAALALSLFLKDTEVVVTPEHNFFGELSVQGDKVNQNYQQAWAYSVSTLIGNINPQNVDFVKKTMMKILSPNLQMQLEPELDKQSEMIKMRNIRQIFIADDLMHEPETDLITVWGQKVTFIDGQPKADTKWSYEFKIKANNGRPRVTYINQYPGTPRKRKEAMAKREKETGVKSTQPTAIPYYDTKLEVSVLEAAKEVSEAEAVEQAQ